MNIDNRQMLPIGALLKQGEYRVERYIASGGFGNTYEVVHTRLNKHLAMKEFFMRGINQREGTSVSTYVEENRSSFEKMKGKFFDEAQQLALMKEMHIVEVSDFFETNGTAYYVMQLIEGESLSAVMKRKGCPMSEEATRRVLEQVLRALEYVHRQGIYHLDIKPGNIMMDAEGHCFLIDFGASKQMSAQESQTLSTSTGLCYTPGYAPSEQISGNMKRIGPWTDFYALGATIYNLLTNQAPPEVDDVKYDGEEVFHFPDSVSADMRQLVIWLMQPDYPKRPQSVEEIKAHFQTQSRGRDDKELSTPSIDVPANMEQRDPDETAQQHSEETVLSIPDKPVQDSSVDTVLSAPTKRTKTNHPKKRKLWPWIIAVAVLLAVVLILSLSREKSAGDGKKQNHPSEAIVPDNNDSISIDQTEEEDLPLEDSMIVIEDINQERHDTLIRENTNSNPVQRPVPVSRNRNFDYGTFEGTWPDDVNGKLTFDSPHIIDSRDSKGRVAESGDYVIGEWSEGHLVQGIWYGADGQIKGSILIGK